MIRRLMIPPSWSVGRAPRRRYQPRLDAIEPRLLLSTFTVTSTADSGAGSLRKAILDANANGGTNTINFDIPGSSPHLIRPVSKLPTINNQVIIDGYTQPGSSPNTSSTGDNAVPAVVIDGSGISDLKQSLGLQIKANNSTVRGLVIQNFNGVGVVLMGANDHLEGNFIGTDAAGKVAQPNGLGVGVLGAGAVIGGTAPAARNVISGNAVGIGIANLTLGSSSSLALGGSSAVTTVGGSVVQNNLIGTDTTGGGNLGNSFAGVAILGSGNVVGGTAAGEANTIAFNHGVGVVVSALEQTPDAPIGVPSTGDLISGNSNFSNHNLGIDLLDVQTSVLLPLINTSIDHLWSVIPNVLSKLNLGVTPNDHLDSDTGPNNLQNFPDLASAVTRNGVTTIRGSLDSTPNTSFRIQFFSSPTANASGYGEGQVFLGETTVKADPSGIAPIVFTPSAAVPVGQVIAATAIDPGNNTSGFSKAITVTPGAVATGPHVVSAQWLVIRAQPRSIVLNFDQAIDPLRAGAVGNYSLFLLTQIRHSSVPRKTPIPIASAVYNPAAMAVTLSPKRLLKARGQYMLTVRGSGSGVADPNGNLLDGNYDGTPGGNFTTILGAPTPKP